MGGGVNASALEPQAPLLRIRDLSVAYRTQHGPLHVVHGVDFDLKPGESLGIVGESGSGKSTVLLAAARLLPSNAVITGGQAYLRGQDLLTADAKALRQVHGPQIGMLYQDSLRALNPVMKIGKQITEVLDAHDAPGVHNETALDLFHSVGLSDPERLMSQYPHQLSGGMRQRVMTAMSLALSPRILFADEPTTALDVTIQAQILDLLRHRAIEMGTAIVIVSHDLGVIANLCQRVLVMYGGRIVEHGTTEEVFSDPRHPYTAALLRSVPRIDRGLRRLPFIEGRPPDPADPPPGCSFAPRCPIVIDECEQGVPPLRSTGEDREAACLRSDDIDEVGVKLISAVQRDAAEHVVDDQQPGSEESILIVRGLTRHFRLGRGRHAPILRAVDGINLDIRRGEFLGLVGESGCGKSTLGRMLVGLEPADAGTVTMDGQEISAAKGRAARSMRRFSQMVFQDPRSSLNRRMTVAQHLEEALVHSPTPRGDRGDRLRELVDQVGLPAAALNKLPDEFSGGQVQRIAIARALAVSPQLIVADEAVSSLDVSVKGQIVNLLRDLQADLGVTVLFISHDLAVCRQVSDRIAVMYLGRLVEVRQTNELFNSPRHPYSRALLSAIPVPDPVAERERERIILTGDVPNPTDPPSGCRFHPRCPVGPNVNPERDICRTIEPQLDDEFHTACHFPHEDVAETVSVELTR
ncbi:MAG: peptide/nickel transport system ATP-binding protein [Verrucomicrobiales bacterium]